jgi:integrase-like protein
MAITRSESRRCRLRHSHATHLLAAGIHPKVASERLGHSKVEITLDLYSHILPGMQAEAAAAVDKAVQAALQKRAADPKCLQSVCKVADLFLQKSLAISKQGRVAEWFKAAVLKTARGASPSWVRIPPLPL